MDSRRRRGVKDDVHRLSHADAIDVLNQAQGNQGRAAAVVDQECEAPAVEHPCPIKHALGGDSRQNEHDPNATCVCTQPTPTLTFVDDHFRDRDGFHSAVLFFAVICADVDKLDSFGDVVPETLFVAGTVDDEGVQDELFDVG